VLLHVAVAGWRPPRRVCVRTAGTTVKDGIA
jgi:hypothetical protein